MRSKLLLAVAATFTTGCTTMLAGAMAVSTPDEIKRSSYVARLDSSRSLPAVSSCLKRALQDAKNGSRPAHVTYRDVGEPHQFVVSNGQASGWSGARPELLALVEASSDGRGGTTATIWAHPYLLSGGGPQGYLANTVALARPCT
jgi:hypothetical protein